MTRIINQNYYTVISPEKLWEAYRQDILRCGRGTHPGLQKLRLGKDIHFATDPFTPNNSMIIPNHKFGISFADSIEKLRKQPVSGTAWKLPFGKQLPDGLCFNYREKDHPLLNVSRVMPENEFISLLQKLSGLMENTKQKV